ncbi:hypothetical protein E0H26_19750 [Micromonospora zingiberis]|uniref:Uncharacterized protein n=1 Tax=Micromonospora zingiberis TaxID=2053011 RepID=A0A4R0GDY6_9ACTN|nr:hypothetical protein [Micromonospora zingiberis]TCB95430.1 hypothetical protein E0H26_19750 [Micromonospora zingiberis]
MTSPQGWLRWEEALTQVLGAQQTDRRQFLDRPWISLVWARNEEVRGTGTPTFDDVPPNQFRFFQPISATTVFTTYRDHTQRFTEIRTIQGRIDWYVGEQGSSPHERFWNEFYNNSRDALNKIPDSSPLSPRSFHMAAGTMYNMAMWLDHATGSLQAEINNLDGGSSGFQGAAAGAFRESLVTLRRNMLTLRRDLESNKNWPQMLRDNGDRAEWFWRDMRAAWSSWSGNILNQPNGLVASALQQIRARVVGGGDGQTDIWDIPIDLGNGPTVYRFREDGALSQLNQDMHNVFLERINDLDQSASVHVSNIRTSFEDTAANLLTPSAVPPTTTGGAGGGADGGSGAGLGGLGGGVGGGAGGGSGAGLGGLGGGADGGSGAGLGGLGGGVGGGAGGGSGAGLGGLGGGGINLGAGGGLGGGAGIGGGAGAGFDGLDGGAGAGLGGSGGGSGIVPPPLPGFGLGSGAGGGSGAGLGLGGIGGSTGGSAGGLTGGIGVGSGLGGLPLPIGGSSGSGGPSRGVDKPGGLPGGVGGDFGEAPSTGGLPTTIGGPSGSGVPADLAGGGTGTLPAIPGGAASPGGGFAGGLPGDNDFTGGLPDGGDLGEGSTGGTWQSGGNSRVPASAMQIGALGPAPLPVGGDNVSGLSGLTAGAGGAALAAGVAAPAGPMTGGAPGMMPPMMGGMGAGAGGGQAEKDRERKTWLAEEEEVWGTDPDVTPSVIGRVDTADELDPDRAYPSVPQGPDSPRTPARGTGRTTGRAY